MTSNFNWPPHFFCIFIPEVASQHVQIEIRRSGMQVASQSQRDRVVVAIASLYARTNCQVE